MPLQQPWLHYHPQIFYPWGVTWAKETNKSCWELNLENRAADQQVGSLLLKWQQFWLCVSLSHLFPLWLLTVSYLISVVEALYSSSVFQVINHHDSLSIPENRHLAHRALKVFSVSEDGLFQVIDCCLGPGSKWWIHIGLLYFFCSSINILGT